MLRNSLVPGAVIPSVPYCVCINTQATQTGLAAITQRCQTSWQLPWALKVLVMVWIPENASKQSRSLAFKNSTRTHTNTHTHKPYKHIPRITGKSTSEHACMPLWHWVQLFGQCSRRYVSLACIGFNTGLRAPAAIYTVWSAPLFTLNSSGPYTTSGTPR